MNDKFSLYQTDGLWEIIENASDEKQTSIKSYFGSDLIIKRLNEQAEQIDQLKQQLAETEQKFLEFQEDSIRNEQTYVRELTEKQNTIDEINKEFVQAVHDWKALCAEKDKEIAHLKEKDNYHLRYELAGADETITNLKQQLEEKDKEIDRLKDFIGCKGCVDVIKKSNKDQTQLAIQELEKTLNFIENVFDKALKNCSLNNVYYDQILDFIDQQIKELKGENK